MIHPRLSVNALSSIRQSFDEDLALWRDLGVGHAGLLMMKLVDDRDAKIARFKTAGLASSTVVGAPFALDAPATWDATRAELCATIDIAVATGSGIAYHPPGRTDGRPWHDMLDVYAEAVAPCVAHAARHGARFAIEPSLRVDVSFVNTLRDAVDVAEHTGVAMIVDFGNCWMERDLREVLARAAPHIGLVQIGDVRIGTPAHPGPGGRVHIGDGELPLRRMMQDVLDTGYSGLFDLEVLGPAIEAEGYAQALRRGVDSASALLAEVGLS